MNRFQQWAAKRKPKKQTKVEEPQDPEPTPEETLRDAWDEFIEAVGVPLILLQFLAYGFGFIILLWGLAVI